MNLATPCVQLLKNAVAEQEAAVKELARVCDRHSCKMEKKGLQLVVRKH